MADSLRELVTVLRYELQEGNLKKYVEGFQRAQEKAREVSDRANAVASGVKQVAGQIVKATGLAGALESRAGDASSAAGRMARELGGAAESAGSIPDKLRQATMVADGMAKRFRVVADATREAMQQVASPVLDIAARVRVVDPDGVLSRVRSKDPQPSTASRLPGVSATPPAPVAPRISIPTADMAGVDHLAEGIQRVATAADGARKKLDAAAAAAESIGERSGESASGLRGRLQQATVAVTALRARAQMLAAPINQAAGAVRWHLQSAVQQAQRATVGLRGRMMQAARSARDFGVGLAEGARTGARDAISSLDRIEARARRLRRESRAAGSAIGSTISGYVRMALAGVGVAGATSAADRMAGIRSSIALNTADAATADRSQRYLFASAQEAGQDYEATTGAFVAVARAREDLELTNDQALVLSDTIGKLMAIGGGSAESQAAALTQFGQALSSGVLRGDELNSVLEQAPRLAKAVAEAFGLSVGQLRTVAAEGKLTSKDLANGLLRQSEKVDAEFERMPMTFGRAMTRMRNQLDQAIDKWNQQTGAAEKFSKAIDFLLGHFDTLVKVSGVLASMWAGSKLLGGLRLIGAYLRPLLLFGVRLGQGKIAMAFAKLGTSGLQFLKVLRWIGTAIAAIGGIGLGPLLLIGAAITAVALLVYKYWEPIKAFFKGVWEGLSTGLADVGTQLSVAFAPLGPVFEQLGQWLGEAFDWLMKLIAPASMTGEELDTAAGKGKAFGQAIATAIETAINIVGFLIDRFVALGTWIGETAAKIVIGFGNAWDALKNGVTELWTWLVSKFSAGWNMLSGMVPGWLKSGVGALMGGGGAALNVSTGQVQNTGRAVNQTVTQHAQVTVNAPGATNPAAVGRAAGDGVTQAQQRIAAAGRVYAPHTTTEAAP